MVTLPTSFTSWIQSDNNIVAVPRQSFLVLLSFTSGKPVKSVGTYQNFPYFSEDLFPPCEHMPGAEVATQHYGIIHQLVVTLCFTEVACWNSGR